MKILNNLFPDIKKQVKIESPQVKSPEQETAQKTSYDMETDKIKAIFDKHQVPMTTENLQAVQGFISDAEGTMDSKLATLDMALEKGVTLTSEHLTQIHMVLNGSMNIEIDRAALFDLKPIKLPEAVRKTVEESLHKDAPVHERLAFAIKSQLNSLFFDLPSNTDEAFSEKKPPMTVENTQARVQAKPEQSEELTREELPVIVQEVFEALGQELDLLADELAPVVNETFFTKEVPPIKFVEREVTVQMQEAKNTFEIYQKAISSQLEKIIAEPTEKVTVKEVLTSVIDKLDHILMKSDVPLYTDIKTERNLLRGSGQLEVARRHLENNVDAAFKIIKKVKEDIDVIRFEPSRQKMFVASKRQVIENLYDKQMIDQMPIQFEDNMQTSPRAVLETLRSLGVNHEAEVSEILNKDQKSAFKAPQNIKQILMKLEESSQKINAKDNLDLLTGQQLLNKLEVKSSKQNMVFQMPVAIDGEMKNLKVHVNAKKEHQKIDWQNCRLYFVVHLNKLGDTGVLVDVNNATAQVTIKNDTDQVEEMMQPYVKEAVKRLEAVGFSTSSIKFEPLYQEKQEKVVRPEIKKEGFDVII